MSLEASATSLARDLLESEDADLFASAGAISASIRIEDDPWRALFPVIVTERVLKALCDHPAAAKARGTTTCDMVFTSDAAMAALNHQFRGRNAPTNVLAFPSGANVPPSAPEPHDLGGIAVGFGVMAREADERGISREAHASHLILHGVLHLLGYDHECDADRIVMERAEVDILSGLGIADPYA
ncbi:MAG: rRNA maturation RNase YbeY [Pseudomonadota bacterium]